MSPQIVGISPGPGNSVCLTPMSIPSSQLTGDVGKTQSWELAMEPDVEPSLLTLSPEFLLLTGNRCHLLKKNALDCSNISFNVVFIYKEKIAHKYRPWVTEATSANRQSHRWTCWDGGFGVACGCPRCWDQTTAYLISIHQVSASLTL